MGSVHLPMEDDGTNKGFGFANFPDPEHAAKAVEKFNNMDIDGSTMYVTRAMKKAEREKHLKEKYERIKAERQKQFAGVNLYVKFLDDSIDDERLKAEFAKFGEITSAKVMRDANGRSRGFGFVCFEKSEQSTIAMAEMNNKIVAGKPLYVALAQRKEVRRATLEKERGMGGRGGERDPKNPGGPAGRGPGGPGGRGRGMGRQMKNPMGYGPQNFNPMYGGRGFNPQQMAMYGPGRQAPMQQGWNPNMRQPMMPGGFRAPMPPYNSMMGMPRTAPAPSQKDFGANQPNRGARPAGGAPA